MLSIITATYNSEKTLKATIDSVLNQDISDFEYILVDGNSSDASVDIIESYSEKFKRKGVKYKWISEPDTGIYDAWNKGVKLATGDWIAFLGSDDFYLEDALKDYSSILNSETSLNYDLVYSNVKVVDGVKTVKIIQGEWSWSVFKRYMNIAHVGSFHSKKYFDKYGLFDSSYKITGDYELLLRAKENLRTHKIDKITAIMNAGGVSNSQISKVFKETLRAKHETANFNIIFCYFDYFLSHFKYYLKKALYAFIR